MKKKKPSKTIVAILVFSMLFLAACSPRHSSHFHGFSKFRSPDNRMEWFKAKIADRLELNESQKTRLDEITNDLIDSGKEMHTIRASIRDTLMTELRKNEINKENLIRVFSENRVKFDDMISMFADQLVEFHQMLRPEQRAKLVAEIEKHQEKYEKYHRHW
jgi:Spy/CpxP family protein refolding chaperone